MQGNCGKARQEILMAELTGRSHLGDGGVWLDARAVSRGQHTDICTDIFAPAATGNPRGRGSPEPVLAAASERSDGPYSLHPCGMACEWIWLPPIGDQTHSVPSGQAPGRRSTCDHRLCRYR
jgi:hypothetical protein